MGWDGNLCLQAPLARAPLCGAKLALLINIIKEGKVQNTKNMFKGYLRVDGFRSQVRDPLQSAVSSID